MAENQILSYGQNPRAKKSLIAARYNGVAVDYPEGFSMRDGHHKTPEFLSMNPFGQVPTLKVKEGGIFESNSAARHIARLGQEKYPLYGKNAYEESRIDAFLDVLLGLDNVIGPWFYPLVGYGTRDEAKEKEAKDRCKKILLGFERALANGNKYLVGDSITLADVVCASAMGQTLSVCMDSEYAADIPNLVRYLKETCALPEFRDVLGDINWSKVDAPVKKSRCHFPDCKCSSEKYGSCGRCFKVVYCCSECQVKDWPRHKSACKAETVFYGLALSGHCLVALLFIKSCNLDVKITAPDMAKGEHKTPEFLKMNPKHTVPTLKDGDFSMWESNAIVRYLCVSRGIKSVYPEDAKTRAWIDMAMDWRQTSFYPTVADATYPLMGWNQNFDKVDAAVAKLDDHWPILRHFLNGNDFIGATQGPSLADYSVCAFIAYLGVNQKVKLPEDIQAYFERFKKACKNYQETVQPLLDFQASKQ